MPPPKPETGPLTYTFTQIIDADHFTIQRLAVRIRKLLARLNTPSLPPSTANGSLPQPSTSHQGVLEDLKLLLFEATYRLIRHDLAEDIVMRPAFATILGSEGEKIAEHDRADHANARRKLLEILRQVNALEGHLSNKCEGCPSPTLPELANTITSTLDTLGEHMTAESGSVLPHLESVIDAATNRRLAAEYADAMIMTPHLHLPGQSASFPGGTEQYACTSMEDMKRMYDGIVAAAKTDEALAKTVRDISRQEVEVLQVGKWVRMSERLASREASPLKQRGKPLFADLNENTSDQTVNEREAVRRDDDDGKMQTRKEKL